MGRAIARRLAQLGAHTAIHDITPDAVQRFGEAESLDAVARQIAEESGNPSIGVHGDVTDEMTVKRMGFRFGVYF